LCSEGAAVAARSRTRDSSAPIAVSCDVPDVEGSLLIGFAKSALSVDRVPPSLTGAEPPGQMRRSCRSASTRAEGPGFLGLTDPRRPCRSTGAWIASRPIDLCP
jgi:hypothetical protein